MWLENSVESSYRLSNKTGTVRCSECSMWQILLHDWATLDGELCKSCQASGVSVSVFAGGMMSGIGWTHQKWRHALTDAEMTCTQAIVFLQGRSLGTRLEMNPSCNSDNTVIVWKWVAWPAVTDKLGVVFFPCRGSIWWIEMAIWCCQCRT